MCVHACPQIWMCIDKDLKPTDCKPQAEHCREVVIPPIPGSSPQAWDEEGEGSWGDIPAGMHFGSHDDQDEDDQDEDASASSESESESDSESDSESESEDDESDSSESGSESEPALYSYSEDEEVEKMRTATASKATAGASTAASKAANAAAAGVAAGAAGPGGASGGPSGAVRDVIIAASGERGTCLATCVRSRCGTGSLWRLCCGLDAAGSECTLCCCATNIANGMVDLNGPTHMAHGAELTWFLDYLRRCPDGGHPDGYAGWSLVPPWQLLAC